MVLNPIEKWEVKAWKCKALNKQPKCKVWSGNHFAGAPRTSQNVSGESLALRVHHIGNQL